MQLKTQLNRRSVIAAGATALVALGASAAWWFGRDTAPKTAVKAKLVKGELPSTDPESKLWNSAERLKVPLLAQTMYYPRLWKATIPSVDVRVLTDGTRLSLLIEWGDAKQNDLESITAFRDAVAVMLPLNPEAERPPIFMGQAGKPVYVMQWKASWQKDMEQGFQGVEKSYPQWFNDVYPGHPTFQKLGQTEEAARQFYPGLALGNPMSTQDRKTCVEEMVAEGYGTLTSLAEQRAVGKASFAGGGWKVAVGMPGPGTDVPALKAGLAVPVAFAVWDGGERQVGGRKHHSDWITVTMPGG